jgi:hypothetical protein
MRATKKKIDQQVELIQAAFAEFTPGLNIPFDQSANYFVNPLDLKSWLTKRSEKR